MGKIRVLALGWVLLLLGVAGMFLPVLPGILLIIAALVLLSREYEWAQRLLTRARQRFPSVAAKAQQLWRRAGIKYGRHRPESSRSEQS